MARVFFSYSHKDESLRDELEAHLALLKNQGLIDVWHDRRIIAGSQLDDAISQELETADVILLLVSSDFLASSYCYSKEMARAMERHQRGDARVIPVILRACDWHSAPFGALLAAPRDGKPVSSWPDKDEAFADVARQVRSAVQPKGALAKASPARFAPAAHQRPAMAPAQAVSAAPRSSNLRLTKEFSDADRDAFVREAFEFCAKFFSGSLDALQERNSEVNCSFDRIDSRRFSAVVYKGGKAISSCSIRLEGWGGRGGNGIAYSNDASAREGSFNEMLSVEATQHSLHLKPLGMSFTPSNQHLTPEGAAEFLWSLLIRPLQS